MKKLISILTILLIGLLTINVYADDEKAIRKHPGYVNFDDIDIPGDAEETVEVYIKGPLLKLVASVTEHEDPALSKMLARLLMVRVNTFSIDSKLAKELKPKVKNIEKQLQKQNWEKIVRVKERDDLVNIYLKFDKKDRIAGLVVMAIEDDDEAVFVNIVGELDWEQISKLGKKFDIDELKDVSEKNKPDK
jgi:hypothetical protein